MNSIYIDIELSKTGLKIPKFKSGKLIHSKYDPEREAINLVNNIDEKVVIERENRLYHIHLHDAQGKKDHMTLGTGDIDIKKYIQLADEHSCTIVLETKTVEALKKSVDWLNRD